MGQFDNQIRQADQIGKDWMKKSKEYEGQFVVLKKNNMKWEKDTLTALQKQVQQGAHNDPATAKDMLAEIESTKERSVMFRKEATRLFDAHEKWALAEPRKSMAQIDTKLKLGGVNAPAYKAVAEACKRQMTDVAGQIKVTQRAFKDVTFALDAMDKRVEGLEAILVQGKSKSSAWTTQLKTLVKQYTDYCEKELVNYKVNNTIAEIRDGKFDRWTDTQIKQQIQLAEANVGQADVIAAQVEKNFGRVVKSVPKEFMSGFMVSAEKAQLEKVKKETLATVKQRGKFWALMITTIKTHPPYAGKF